MGKGLQQLVEGMLLGLGAGVFCNASLIQTALIDDTKGAVVVMAGMDTLDALGQQRDDTAIVANIVVVAALAVLGLAASNEVLYAEGLIALIGHAVDDK